MIFAATWKRVIARLLDLFLILVLTAVTQIIIASVQNTEDTVNISSLFPFLNSLLIYTSWLFVCTVFLPIFTIGKQSIGKLVLGIGFHDSHKITLFDLIRRETVMMLFPVLIAAAIFYIYLIIFPNIDDEALQKIKAISSNFVFFWFVFIFLFQKLNPRHQLFFDRASDIFVVELVSDKKPQLKTVQSNSDHNILKSIQEASMSVSEIQKTDPQLLPLLEKLNQHQRAAVMSDFQKNLLILAGPGTGKTTVLMTRIAALVITKQVPIKKILALTFTKKACENLRIRLQHNLTTVNPIDSNQFSIYTFHGFCFYFLQRELQHLNLVKHKEITVIDDSDRKRIIRMIINTTLFKDPEEKILFIAEIRKINNLFDTFMRAKISDFGRFQEVFSQADSKTILNEDNQKMMWEIYNKYLNYKKTEELFDFIDLLYKAVKLLQTNPAVLMKWRRIFSYIFVDEFQDTNEIQYTLIALLSNHGAELPVTVVGDPDQTIYGWRGSEIKFINEFSQTFLPSKRVTLDLNYRSTPEILDLANKIITLNKDRIPKTIVSTKPSGTAVELISEYDQFRQAEKIATAIDDEIRIDGQQPREIAILYRSNFLSAFLEKELMKLEIPYVIVKGIDFFRRVEIKEMNTMLRLLLIDSDVFSRTALGWIEGIGEVTAHKLALHAQAEEMSLFNYLNSPKFIENPKFSKLSPKIILIFGELATIKAELVANPELPVKTLILKLLNNIYQPLMLRRFLDVDKKMSYIENYIALLDNYAKKQDVSRLANTATLLKEFLNQIMIDIPGELHDPSNKVQLMTIHSSKGMEFDSVYLYNATEGVFPSSWSTDIEEERRLFFVAITRARYRLTISTTDYKQSMFIKGVHADLIEESDGFRRSPKEKKINQKVF